MGNEEVEKGVRPHYQLQAWQVSMKLVKLVYLWSKCFPPEEKYGLLSQIRRAAVSVPSNIAEGAARNGSREFAHFLSIARGSLGFAEPKQELAECIDHASRLITGLYKRHAIKDKK